MTTRHVPPALWHRRAELERAGSAILRADRRHQRRVSSPAKSPAPPLEMKNGWVAGLTNLRRAMRHKEQS
jgi:hypothetical protein